MSKNIDWVIHFVANGVACAECGKVEDSFIEYYKLDIPGNIKYIVAPPRMQLYIDCAAEIHGVFLKHFAPQDIFTYSIDESFIDATPYLKMYNIPTRELAKRVIDDIHKFPV